MESVDQQTEREITEKLITEDLRKEWEKKVEKARQSQLTVKVGAKTDLGRVRENNEDKFDFLEPEDSDVLARKGSLYAVADGMGGHSAGQIASELALKNVIKAYYADPLPDVAGSLKNAVAEANSLIFDTAQAITERSGMGTTVTIAVIRGHELYVAQVGDSRAYLVRDGQIRQITEDHSWVAEQVKRGALTEEEAESSPFRNVITRSLGTNCCVDVDVFLEELEVGDIIVLCSDGLSGLVSSEEIGQIAQDKAPSIAAMELVDKASENGGTDNITAMVISVREPIERKRRRRLFGG